MTETFPRRGALSARVSKAACVGALGALLSLTVMGITPPAYGDAGCDKYADPAGNDANDGSTPALAKKSPIALLAALQPGQDGCLTDGATFTLGGGEAITSAAGSPGLPKILRPTTPGARSNITTATGFWIQPAARDLVLRDLDIRRSGATGGSLFLVDGDRIVLEGLDLTYPANICLDVGGDPRAGAADPAEDLVLRRSRIHHCGSAYGPPRFPNDSGVHGIYLQFLRDGVDADDRSAIVEDNLIYENHNRGLQLYPDADDTLVQFNVLHRNGANLNLGSEGAIASERNMITNNILTDSTLDGLTPGGFVGDTSEVLGNFPTAPAPDNHVDGNCISNTTYPNELYEGTGFTRVGNIENQPPGYTNAGAGDFTLVPGSPCNGKGPRPAPGATLCRGRTATVVGLTGTPGDDVIIGTAENDVMKGLGGNDTICGGEGFDTISGGPGDDVLDGQGGGDGADYGPAAAGVRVDLAIDGVPQATGEGADTLISFSEAYGSAYNDTLLGRNNNGTVFELLYGAGGNDVLNGRGGNDTLSGATGSDLMLGGKGRDTFLGGGGVDTASYADHPAGVTVVIDGVANDGNSDDGVDGARDRVSTDVENLLGGPGSDRLTGSGTPNRLTGGAGDDVLTGLGGADAFIAGDGADQLLARDGVVDARLDCGVGTDRLTVDASDPAGVGCETLVP